MQGHVLNLAEDNHILSAGTYLIIPEGAIVVPELPEGDIIDYRYENGEFIYDPIPRQKQIQPNITNLDLLEAQVVYTAMMTKTLLE